jgi:preprotein translocase subunit SecG
MRKTATIVAAATQVAAVLVLRLLISAAGGDDSGSAAGVSGVAELTDDRGMAQLQVQRRVTCAG